MLKCSNAKMKKRGFTLIELLAVIFVIIVGVVGIVAVIQQTVSFMNLSSSRLIASYLAQEGIEIARNIRDTNWLKEEDWKTGLAGGDWQADYNDLALSNYDDNDFLKIDISGFYSYDSENNTKFKRKITIVPPGGGEASIGPLKISVLVIWRQFGKEYEVTAEEHLYNWL